MKGGICPKHETELSGFGTMVFCNECDAEAAIMESMGASLGPMDDITEEMKIEYGYYVSLKKLKNELVVEPCDQIRLKRPNLGLTNGFLYRFPLHLIKYTITADGRYVYPDDTYIGVPIELVT